MSNNKKRRNKYSIPPKFVLVFLTIISVTMIALTLRNTNSLNFLRTTSSSVIIPVQKGMNTIGSWFYNRAEDIKELNALKKENESLKTKIDELTIDNTLLIQNRAEHERLLELYELDNYYKDYPKVAARVIGKDAGNWFSVFTIDKGLDDGIKVNMNVLAGSGLVGIVTYVGKNYSTVRTIIDDESNVSAKFSSTSDNCIVQGDLTLINEGYLNVIQITKDALVKEGDMLLTSNISDKYLPGLLIGYVKDIKEDSNNLTKSAKVTPVVDFNHIEIVLVVTQIKENIDK